MPKLKGFESANEAARAKANEGFELSRSTSVFVHGLRFKITGFDWKHAVYGDNSKSESLYPVFTTSLGKDAMGEDIVLFVRALNKALVDADNNIIYHQGTFNLRVAEISREMYGKSDGEQLAAMVEEFKDKEIEVTRVPYAVRAGEGRKGSSYVEYNFVVE